QDGSGDAAEQGRTGEAPAVRPIRGRGPSTSPGGRWRGTDGGTEVEKSRALKSSHVAPKRPGRWDCRPEENGGRERNKEPAHARASSITPRTAAASVTARRPASPAAAPTLLADAEAETATDPSLRRVLDQRQVVAEVEGFRRTMAAGTAVVGGM